MDFAADIILGIIVAATPLLFSALGELVVEKSGVLNLGVAGMMIVGAIAAFSTTYATGSHAAGVAAAALGGTVMAALFGTLVLVLRANQVASGLALTMFGLGVSALWGQGYSGLSTGRFPRLDAAWAAGIPVLGRLLTSLDPLAYLAIVLVGLVSWFLRYNRHGLILRAIGENHDAAHAVVVTLEQAVQRRGVSALRRVDQFDGAQRGFARGGRRHGLLALASDGSDLGLERLERRRVAHDLVELELLVSAVAALAVHGLLQSPSPEVAGS